MEQQVLCRFCEGSDISERFPAADIFDQGWSICQCTSCKAFFLAPFPTEEQLRKSYDASYYGKGDHKFVFSVEQFIDFFRKRKARKISRIIPRNAKVLDVGCGNGKFLKHLSSLGAYELYGTELEGGSAERASSIKEISLKIGPLKENDYPGEYFNAVTLFHVFEHLEAPKKTLEIIYKILKQDGIFVLTFPNISGWQAKAFKGRWYHLDPPRHLIFFRPEDIAAIITGMGFSLKKINYFSFEQNPYGWVQSMLNVWHRKREFLYERLKGNKKYAQEYSGLRYFLNILFFILSFPLFAAFDIIESLFGKSATVRLEFRKK